MPLNNPSAKLLREWIENDTFIWLVTDEILLEHKQILARLGVRRPVIGKVINLIREEAESVAVSEKFLLTQEMIPFALVLKLAIVTLNPKDFPQQHLSAHVIGPGESVPTTARQKRRRGSSS